MLLPGILHGRRRQVLARHIVAAEAVPARLGRRGPRRGACGILHAGRGVAVLVLEVGAFGLATLEAQVTGHGRDSGFALVGGRGGGAGGGPVGGRGDDGGSDGIRVRIAAAAAHDLPRAQRRTTFAAADYYRAAECRWSCWWMRHGWFGGSKGEKAV